MYWVLQYSISPPAPIFSMKQSSAWTSYKEKVRQLSGRIVEAQRPIRVRDGIKWDEQIEAQVIASKFKQLPEVGPEYYAQKRPLPYQPAVKIEEFASIQREVERSIG